MRGCVLGEIHGPDSCSRAEVKNSLDFIADRCEEKIATEDKTVDMMAQIHSILFFVIVGLTTVSISFRGGVSTYN